MKMILTGFLKLGRSLHCLGDVLGQIIPAQINNINVLVHFPRADENTFQPDGMKGIACPLLSPEIFKKWTLKCKPFEWGYPASLPKFTAVVERVVITCECEEYQREGIAEKIYSDIERWEKSFLNYCFVSNIELSERDYNKEPFESEFFLCDKSYIPRKKAPGGMVINTSEPENALSLNLITNAIKFASSEKDLRLEYQMLLSACNAVSENNNRQAIVDACSALEICLVNVITKECQRIGIDKDILLEKYRSLGDRVSLAKKLFTNVSLPDAKSLVVYPRNNLAHNNNIYPTDKITDQLIACVKSWLDHFCAVMYE